MPEARAPTLQGAPTYDFVKFSQQLHEIERIWIPKGSRIPRVPSPTNVIGWRPLWKILDPPLGLNTIRKKQGYFRILELRILFILPG